MGEEPQHCLGFANVCCGSYSPFYIMLNTLTFANVHWHLLLVEQHVRKALQGALLVGLFDEERYVVVAASV